MISSTYKKQSQSSSMTKKVKIVRVRQDFERSFAHLLQAMDQFRHTAYAILDCAVETAGEYAIFSAPKANSARSPKNSRKSKRKRLSSRQTKGSTKE